jgi:tripartite-type tricarboxylate transporter receptor subunit TctC
MDSLQSNPSGLSLLTKPLVRFASSKHRPGPAVALAVVVGVAATISAAAAADLAQSYPSRLVRIVSGFPPGGFNDAYARLIAQWLSEHMGQAFIVENRPGAGGNIAAESVARATPDGYTLLLTTSADAWNSTLYTNAKFNLVRDFTPVGSLARVIGVLVEHPSVSPQTVPELIAYAKSHPGKLTIGSAGIGSSPHMYWELFRSMTGVNMVHVAYRGGGPAMIDLLGGQIFIYFSGMVTAAPHIKTRKLKALAVTTAARVSVLPDVPAMAEHLPGFEATTFTGISAPRGTPADVVERLSREISAGVTDPKFRQRISDLGDTPLAMSHTEFSKLVADESEKWAKVIRAGNIKAE